MGVHGSQLPKIKIQFLHDIDEQPHFHQDLELLYVAEGELVVKKATCEVLMKQDDVLLLNSNNSHAVTGGEGLSLLQIHISFQMLEATKL
ncbi:MAG: cupin domain-containing protein [Clostridiales bacterium]|nr:cupin domain-containing protein [Clostridiales bacterium]